MTVPLPLKKEAHPTLAAKRRMFLVFVGHITEISVAGEYEYEVCPLKLMSAV